MVDLHHLTSHHHLMPKPQFLYSCMIYGGAIDSIFFGVAVFMAQQTTLNGVTGLVTAIGGFILSFYGLYLQGRKTNVKVGELRVDVDENKRLIQEAKDRGRQESKAEIDKLKMEIISMKKRQNESSLMLRDINTERAAVKGMTPDPDNPMPVVVVKDLTRPPAKPETP